MYVLYTVCKRICIRTKSSDILTQRTEHRHSSLKQRTNFRCLCISWPLSAYILPLFVRTFSRSHRTDIPLSYSALTSVGLCLSLLNMNSALTHVHFALNLPHTTNTHPLFAHIPSALTQLTHNALTQRTQDLRCRIIRDERQLALGVDCLTFTTVCTHPLFC